MEELSLMMLKSVMLDEAEMEIDKEKREWGGGKWRKDEQMGEEKDDQEREGTFWVFS